MKYLIPVGADTLIFDVAGNADVVAALHTRLGDTIPYSGAVANALERRCLRSEPRSTRRETGILVSTRSIAVLRERIGSGAMMRQMGLQ